MDKDFYINSRSKIANDLKDREILVLFAGKDICQSADEAYKFTINRNFYYLTGINEQNDILVMVNTNGNVETYIFINEYDEYVAKWYGRKMLDNEVLDVSGITNIKYLKDFDEFIQKYINDGYTFLLDMEKGPFEEPTKESIKFIQKYNIEAVNSHNILAKYRLEKEEAELKLMRNAIEITNKGIKSIMENIKPGMYEYQVESYFDQQIKYHGASGHAFKTIAASGINGCVLHYSTNNNIINDNELVLFDLGAEYQLYKSDITRTIPASGKFTARQKEIYQIVLNGQKLVFKSIKPGISTKELNEILINYYKTELKKIGLIKEDNEVFKYYFHGVSHQIGLDTHDISIASKPLTPGCVISVEPGLYIKEEKIGIRIEDDALVTENGSINLSKDIIKEIDEIEDYMQKNNKYLKAN